MEEKNSKFNFRMKIIVSSLMIGIMIMLSILFSTTANAYNLPSYEPNKNSSIEDDFKAFGMSIYDYQSNYDGKDEWQVVYIAENYTESNGHIVNYFYLYNKCLDNTIVCFNLKMNLNNQSNFDAVIDDYTRGPDEIIGDTWTNREMIMTYSDRLLIGDNDTYHNIIKLRLEANVLNLDEKRVYQTESISYRSYTNSNHANTIIKTTNLNYSKTYNSVYTDDDRENPSIDLPLYREAWKGYDANENEIYFSYVNCGFNTKLSQIKLNNETVPLEFVEHDNVENISVFKTNAFGLKARGTMTYKINGYYVGSKFYDTSKEDVVFRYVSNLTSVEVEADKTISHHWAPIGGNYSIVEFYLKEKKSGKVITNARSVSENMKWRIKKDLSEGIMWGGKSHLGYELIDKKLVLIPEEAKIVKRVFQLFIEGCGIQKIANSFNKEGIQPKYSDHWNKSSVRHILSNVNYTGDLLLQKTYRESYLTKKKRINKGEQDQFLVENDHEAIIDKDTFNLAQQLLAERGVLPKSNYIKGNKSIFTSRIKCGLCGASYRHKTTRYKKIWICHTYDSEGKENCSAKQIPEDNLIKAINQYLGIDSFSEDAFNKKIDYITVFPGNVLRIKRVDGNEDDITWNDPKRSEGWTPEMREKARQRAKAHYKKEGADE